MDSMTTFDAEWNSIRDHLLTLRKKGIAIEGGCIGVAMEWYCTKAFKLTLKEHYHKGFDALDADGKRIQIKSRKWIPSGNSFDNLSLDNFDYLMPLIYYDDTLIVKEVYKIPVAVVAKIGLGKGNRLRWTNETEKICKPYRLR